MVRFIAVVLLPPALYRLASPWLVAASRAVAPACLAAGAWWPSPESLRSGVRYGGAPTAGSAGAHLVDDGLMAHPHSVGPEDEAIEFSLRWYPLMDIAFNCIHPTSILVEAVYGIFSLSCVLAMGLMSTLPDARLPRGFFLPHQVAKCVLSTLALLAIEWCRLLYTSRSNSSSADGSSCSSAGVSRAGSYGSCSSAPGLSASRLLGLAAAQAAGDAAAVAGGGEGGEARDRGGGGACAVPGGVGAWAAGPAGQEGGLVMAERGPLRASRRIGNGNGNAAVGGATDCEDGQGPAPGANPGAKPEGRSKRGQVLHHRQQQQQQQQQLGGHQQQQQQRQRQADSWCSPRLVAAGTRRLRGCTTQRLDLREAAKQMALELGPGLALAVAALQPQQQLLARSAAAAQQQLPQRLRLHARALPPCTAFRARLPQAAASGGPREGLAPPSPGSGPSVGWLLPAQSLPPPRSQHEAEPEPEVGALLVPVTVAAEAAAEARGGGQQPQSQQQHRRHGADHVPYRGRTTMYSTRIKIAGCKPEQVSPGYLERIARVAVEAGLQLEAVALRRGCIELVVDTRAVDEAPAPAGSEAAEAGAAAPAAVAESSSGCRLTRGSAGGRPCEGGSGSGFSAAWAEMAAPPADHYNEGDVLDVGLLIRALQLPESSSSLEFDFEPGSEDERGGNSGGAASAATGGSGEGGGAEDVEAAAAAAAAGVGLGLASSAGASRQILLPFVLDVYPRVLPVGPAPSSCPALQTAVHQGPAQGVAAAAAGGGDSGAASLGGTLVMAVSWAPSLRAREPSAVQTVMAVAVAPPEGAAGERGLGLRPAADPAAPPQPLPGVQILLRSRGQLVAVAGLSPYAAAAETAAEPPPLPPTPAGMEPGGDVDGGGGTSDSAAADKRPRPSAAAAAEAEAAVTAVARGGVSGQEGGGTVLYGVDVGPLLAQLRPGVLLVDVRLGPPSSPAADDSNGPAAVPVLALDNPRVAAELQMALDSWYGTADELNSLLYDMGALVRMQDELTACADALAAAGGSDGSDGDVSSGSAAAIQLSVLKARTTMLYTHLVSYMEVMSWEGARSWLRARQQDAVAAVAAVTTAAVATAAVATHAAGCTTSARNGHIVAELAAWPAASDGAAAATEAAATALAGLDLTGGTAAAAAAPPPPRDAAAALSKTSHVEHARSSGSWPRLASRLRQLLPPAFWRLSRLLLIVLGWHNEGEADAAAYASYRSSFTASTMNVMQVLDILGFITVMACSSGGGSGGAAATEHAARAASPASQWLGPDKACVLVAASTGVVMGALWLLLPRPTWRRISAHTKWPRQASYTLSKAMVAFFGFRQPPLALRHELGSSIFVVEGVILPAAVLMSPMESVVMGLLRAPLCARMWLLADADAGWGPGSGSRHQTVVTALLRALALSALSVLTTVVVHLYIRMSYERKRGSAQHAKAD